MDLLIFKAQVWLARRSERLDRYFADRFMRQHRELVKRELDNFDLTTDDISIIS